MTFTNSSDRYGAVARSLHWLTAGLILMLLPLGLIAEQWPYDTAAALTRKTQLFSLHKTLGVAVFFVALARILWAATQPRPGSLHADRPLENRLAETIHFLLYASLVATPLTGWIHHAATSGFAPIWWPFGQSLPLVPKSEAVAAAFSGMHFLAVLTLVASLALHIAGAFKHHLIDRDATLRRMLLGTAAGSAQAGAAHRHRLPRVAALATLLLALGAGAVTGLYAPAPAPRETAALEQAPSGWQVQEGVVGLTIRQMGAEVTGHFADWTAVIDFAETPVDGRHGRAEVTIAIASLGLGSVTDQAMGAGYFDVARFPTATFTADLLSADGGGHVAEGALVLRGTEVPLTMPFTLEIDGDVARMQARLTLDRRDFHIGDTLPDETSLGFAVVVDIALTAVRSD